MKKNYCNLILTKAFVRSAHSGKSACLNKSNWLKTAIFSGLMLVLGLSLPEICEAKINQDWIKYDEQPGFIIYYKYGVCDNANVVFFKLENKSSSAKCFTIAAKVKENNSTTEESLPKISLCAEGQQTFVGDCENIKIPRGYVQKATISGSYANPVFTATVTELQ